MIWPGAKNTGSLGLRTNKKVLAAGASPIHLGVDHAGKIQRLRMPFNGMWKWEHVGGVAGSLLRITPPIGSKNKIEIQIFHTMGEALGWQESEAGEEILATPSDLGLSVGVHTHTELIAPADEDDLPHANIWYVIGGTPRKGNVLMHCRKHMMKFDEVWPLVEKQVVSWGIRHATDQWAIRETLPEYRKPWFGDGPTIHMDPEKLYR